MQRRSLDKKRKRQSSPLGPYLLSPAQYACDRSLCRARLCLWRGQHAEDSMLAMSLWRSRRSSCASIYSVSFSYVRYNQYTRFHDRLRYGKLDKELCICNEQKKSECFHGSVFIPTVISSPHLCATAIPDGTRPFFLILFSSPPLKYPSSTSHSSPPPDQTIPYGHLKAYVHTRTNQTRWCRGPERKHSSKEERTRYAYQKGRCHQNR
jgi:hypothetical protein